MLYFTLLSSKTYALTTDEARHLLSRIGFAPSYSEIEPYLPLSKAEAVQHRLEELNTTPYTDMPEEFSLPFKQTINGKKATREEKQAFRKRLRQKTNKLQEWWFHEMLVTDSPFTENLTLFWHNHFVSSSQKVRRPEMMGQQNQTLRKYSSGNFKEFVLAILKDPAMIQYLDNQQNRKGKINENLARELLELFTMGEGHYSESDIKNVAWILTGQRFQPKTGEYIFQQKLHDSSPTTIFGKSGTHEINDLVDAICAQPATANYIVNKLWNHFITTPISQEELVQLSTQFRKNYEIKPLLKIILTSKQFWQNDNIGTQIKSPVQMVVGSYRQFQWSPEKIKPLINKTTQMGQRILYPPNVKGWQTGENWINTTTLLARQNFMDGITRGMTLERKALQLNLTNSQWLDTLIAKPLQSRIEKTENTWELINNALNAPSYQLQ